MSFIEKLLIRNTVNSESFLKKYFIGTYIYMAILLLLFLLNFFVSGQVITILLFAHTTFIIIHTIYLFPSLFNLLIVPKRSGPIWEKAVVVAIGNFCVIVIALTFSSYVFHNHEFSF